MPAGKAFVDTNILVYAQDRDAPAKRRRSREVIAELAASGTGVISTQVVQEFYVATTRKMGVDPLSAKGILRTFTAFEITQTSLDLIEDAVDCSILNQISFWDALIVAAAAATGCSTIYSEDLNAGQVFQGVRIVNPFAA